MSKHPIAWHCPECGSFNGDKAGVCFHCKELRVAPETASIDGTAKAQKHYQCSSVQPIEIMQENLSKEEFVGYLRGNIIKYVLRFGHKDATAREADKIAQYAEWLAMAVRGEKINPRI